MLPFCIPYQVKTDNFLRNVYVVTQLRNNFEFMYLPYFFYNYTIYIYIRGGGAYNII